MLVGDLDEDPGDDDLFLGEILRSRRLDGLLTVEVSERGGKIRVVVVQVARLTGADLLLDLFSRGGEGGSDAAGRGVFGRSGVGGFAIAQNGFAIAPNGFAGLRFKSLDRGALPSAAFMRQGFDFGVQRCALDYFRIMVVYHD